MITLGLALSFAYTLRQPVLYVANASGYVVAGNSSTVGDAFSGASLAKERAAAYVPLVSSRPVAERVIEELGIDADPSGLAASISASVAPDSNLMQIQATSSSPEQAQAVANAVIAATAAEAFEIENQDRAEGEQANSIIQVVPVEEALLPTSPSSPDYPFNLAIGALIGLGAGYAIAFIRTRLDRKIRSVSDVEETIDVPVLGILPDTKDLRTAPVDGSLEDQGPASEALRQLRTNLRFADVDRPPRSIIVTSSNAQEGKSTVASNLAIMLASAGQRTLLVDADLRRPTVAKRMGADSAVGLTQVLAGDVDVADTIQDSDIPHLSILTAGRVPPNPSELLGSLRMEQLVRELSGDYFVIFDAPPLLPVTDGGLLSAAVDGTLLVVTVGSTFKENIQQSAKILSRVNSKLLGVVLNKAPMKGMGSVVYGYGYKTSKQDSYYTSVYGKASQRKAKAEKKAAAKAGPIDETSTTGERDLSAESRRSRRS